MSHRARLSVALFVVAVSACECGPGEEGQDAGVNFPREKMAAHCFSSAPVHSIRLVTAPDTYLATVQEISGGALVDTHGALLTRDFGRTFERLPYDQLTSSGALERKSVPFAYRAYVLDESFWATFDGAELLDKLPLEELTQTYLVMVLDGRGMQAKGAVGVTWQSGLRTDATWKANATHWMGVSSGWVYASRDGGKTAIRLEPLHHRRPVGAALMFRHAFNGDAGLYEGDELATHLLSADGTLSDLGSLLEGLGGIGKTHASGFWGERVVMSGFGPLYVRDGEAWTKLEVDEPTEKVLHSQTDRAGNLWAYPQEHDDVATFKVYRYAPGQTTPTIIDFEFGDLTVGAIGSVHFLPDGRIRFLARNGNTRDHQARMFCEAGPGVTSAQEQIVEEGLSAALSDRVITYARMGTLTSPFDRLVVTPSGRPVTTSRNHVRSAGPRAPTLYSPPPLDDYEAQQFDGGIFAFGLFGATDKTVSFTTVTLTQLLVDPPQMRATYDLASGARLSDSRLGWPEPLFRVDEVGPVSLARFEDETMLMDRFAPETGGERPPKFHRGLVLGPHHGVVMSDLRHTRDGYSGQDEFLLRFDPTKRVPDIEVCFPEPLPDGGRPPRAPACLKTPEMGAIDALIDEAGTLYALDRRAGKVWGLAADAGADGWQELAKGFIVPSDLHLRQANGKNVLLVLDGDVLAFSPESGKTKVRGAHRPPAAPGPSPDADRTLADCAVDGPCVAPESTVGVHDLSDASQTKCLLGERFGSSPGTLLLGTEVAPTLSWGDSAVCVRHAAASDGLLRIVRADGRFSNRVPHGASPSVTEWVVPSEVFPDTVLTVKGVNLGYAPITTVSNAEVLSASDGLVTLRVPAPGLQSLTLRKGTKVVSAQGVTVKPKLLKGCRSGLDQGCVVYGLGFGNGSTVASALITLGHTALVGGLPAELRSWGPTEIAFEWPPTLAPGVHAFTLHHPDGWDVVGQVELLAEKADPIVVMHDGPFPAAVHWSHARPTETDAGLVAHHLVWPQGAVINGEAVPGIPYRQGTLVEREAYDFGKPWEVVPRMAYASAGATYPLHVFAANGETYSIATAEPSLNAVLVGRMTQRVPRNGFEGFFAQEVGRFVPPGNIPANEPVMVADVLPREASTFVAIERAFAQKTLIAKLAYQPDGGVELGAATEVAGAPGFNRGSVPAALPTVLVDGGVYFTSCHLETDAGVRFVEIQEEEDGGLVTGAAQTVVAGGPGSAILACNRSQRGIVWIQREPGGAERVYSHAPGEGAATLIAEVPPGSPGVGQRETFSANVNLPGLMDLAVLPDGDVLVLANEQVTAPRGLRLLRYDVTGGAWTIGADVVAPSTQLARGEECIGPFSSRSACERHGRDGCAPLACSISPPELRARPTTLVGEAYLTVRGNDALIVYETVETKRVMSTTYGGTDVLFVKVPLP